MSKQKNQKRERFKNKKDKKKLKQDEATNVPKTSISKKQVSGNWITFIKSNASQGKAFKIKKELLGSVEKQAIPRVPVITKVLAIDCEMVSDENDQDMLGRVSVVNFKLETVYDKFVKPTGTIGDYRTRFSGLRPSDLENGEDFGKVRKEVLNLIRNRIVVGHALNNDFKVLKLDHHRKLIRDSSTYEPFKKVTDGKTPSLKILVKNFFNENIQGGEHSSVEDAKAAMKLYKMFRHEWEASLLNSKQKDVNNLVPSIKPVI